MAARQLLVPLARGLLWLEPLILAAATYAFWFPTPGRLDWLWMLWLLVPLALARWVCYGRVLTRTPLDPVFAAFLILGVVNIYAAPYTRGLHMLARPLLGMATVYALVEHARVKGLRGPVQVMVMLSLLVGLQAIGGTQWNPKSQPLQMFTQALPTIQGAATAGGFNANEIAGGMIWLVPLMAGIAIYRWQAQGIRWDVTLAFLLLLLAMLLGQSRSAIAGLVVALALVSTLLRGGWRIAGWTVVVAIIALELALFADDFTTISAGTLPEETAALIAEPDEPITQAESTAATRLEIWNSAASIIRDHPVFGVGLAMFRDVRVRAQYPAPSYTMGIVPHAHNEYLQIGADMGIPGLIVLLAIYAVAARMLVQAWRVGDAETRALSVAVGAGLLAHAIFGLSDAITLWDRFAFIFWLMLGMAGAAYVHAQANPA